MTTSLVHLTSGTDRQLKLFTQAAALAVMVVGAVALIGRTFNTDAFKHLLPNLVSMKANTALGLAMAGAALSLLAEAGALGWRRRIGLACAATVALLGLLTLSEYLFGIGFGIDQLFFNDAAALALPPGRMGANTALGFILFGSALLLLDARTPLGARVAPWVTLVGLSIALAALIGYAYGVAYLTRLSSATQMSLPTALAFVALAAGLLTARPHRPQMALFLSQNPGGLMLRRMWPQVILLFALLGWLNVMSERLGVYEATFGAALLVLVVAGLFSLLIWRVARALERLDTERAAAEAAVSQSDARLRVTLRSIGDAVIATDADSRVSFMNVVAEKLTGWTQAEAAGRRLEEVFCIVNEQTRVTVETPVAKVIREGATVGLANHTVLIARDGREIPIDDSGAPIRDDAGQITGVVLVFRDSLERKQNEEQIKYQLALTESITDNTQSCLLMMDAEGRATFANHATERVTGFKPEELIGEVLHQKLHHMRPDGSPFPMEECPLECELSRKEAVISYEDSFIHQDGHFYPVRCAGRLIYKNGSPVGTVIEVQDITEEKRLLAAERRARELAETANRLKDVFLATISHELRTPLNHMLGWVVLLRGGKLAPAKTAEALETIERNVRAQNRLVEDLLDVSRIISGKMQLHVQPVIPAQVVEAAIASARPAAEARGIRLQAVLDSRASTVSGDPDRMQQIVWNLISNAIKFTPKGGRVQVRLDRIQSHVEITVSDTGEGIAPEFLPHVFDRFSQADGSIKRSRGGLGLGLAIVRHLVELHGGEVSVTSAGLGKGSTFTVTLPLRIADSVLRVEEVTETPASGDQSVKGDQLASILKGVRVLVVDDEADSRLLVATLLTSSEAEVRLAGSLAEALKTLDEWRPDVLISDIGMPHGDGYDLIREIRARDEATGQWLPAVALTAYARSEDRMRAIASGFQMHVAKPVEPAELITVIASLTRRLVRTE